MIDTSFLPGMHWFLPSLVSVKCSSQLEVVGGWRSILISSLFIAVSLFDSIHANGDSDIRISSC